jgi:hypothetical protein
MSIRIIVGGLALAAALAACDRPTPTDVAQEAAPVSQRTAMDRLARRFARAMADPAFRAYVKSELDRSQVREHKLHFQRFLSASGRRVMREVARLSAEPDSAVEQDARAAQTLEMYLPVPAHRAAWNGGENILVASAEQDHEAPVAYDVRGRRYSLSASAPPATPVLAIEPAEADFGPEGTTGFQVDPIPPPSPPPPPPSPPSGLYMTYSHFVQDFEGWFKGSPEFEIHIFGQLNKSDSLTSYQCAGAVASGYYRFDQNNLDWSGSVLLFTQAQLNSYKTAHPNQNFRIIALEDDDTGCFVKLDADRFKKFVNTINVEYPNLTGAKDTSSSVSRWVKRANALQKILRAAYSFITTHDDLIGDAIEDVVIGQSYPGANWIVKGEGNKTNGWIKLQMR